jgi:hypothetical protein
MEASLKKSLTRFAKQDIRLAKKQGSVIVVDCKVFDIVCNVTVFYRAEDKLFNIKWLGSKSEMCYWNALTEQMVIDFMLDAYQIVNN